MNTFALFVLITACVWLLGSLSDGGLVAKANLVIDESKEQTAEAVEDGRSPKNDVARIMFQTMVGSLWPSVLSARRRPCYGVYQG